MNILLLTGKPDHSFYLAWAKRKGVQLVLCDLVAENELPPESSFDKILLLDSPLREHRPSLISYLKTCVANKKSLLGIWKGANLVGSLFEGEPEESPYEERGVFPVNVTELGEKDPLLKGLTLRFDAFHWHKRMPPLPKGAKVLAKTEGCPRQIIRYTPNVYTLLPPVGIEPNTVKKLYESSKNLPEEGEYIQTLDEVLAFKLPRVSTNLTKILENFVEM